MKKFFKRYSRIIAVVMVLALMISSVRFASILVAAEDDEYGQEILVTSEETTEETTGETTEEPTEETTEEPTEEKTEEKTEETTGETTEEKTEEKTEETTEEPTGETTEEQATAEGNFQAITNSLIGESTETTTTNSVEIISTTDSVAEDGVTLKTGSYQAVLPSVGDEGVEEDTTYSVSICIVRYDNNGDYLYGMSDEVYKITITDASGEVVDTGNWKFAYAYNSEHEHPELGITFEGIQAGYTISVENIVAERIEYDAGGDPIWSSYYDTRIGVDVTDETNSSNVVIPSDSNPIPLVIDGTVGHTFTVEELELTRETEEDFTSIGGTYSLLYLMNNYNVVSYEDIESTHIVGPIIAQDSAYRPTDDVDDSEESNGTLYASDYSKAVPSYVGDPTYYDTGSGAQPAFQLNYGFDREYNSAFIAPYFYTTLTDYSLGIEAVTIHDYTSDYFIDEDGTKYVSPNDSGAQLTYQSDAFIDFNTLWSAINATSQSILTNGTIEDTAVAESLIYTYDDSAFDGTDASTIKVYQGGILLTGDALLTSQGTSRVEITGTGEVQLNIEAGESWTITTADDLDIVNIIYPDGYDYFTNPYLIPTTINFSCSTINPTYIDGDGDGVEELHSQFPQTLINGVEIAAEQGENGEFGEGGNKIIWNFPNIVTDSETGENRLVTYGESQNILGHIIAPNAEFWNYGENTDGSLFWEGGNINGTIIVKDFHSGVAEMHMWAYDGNSESAVYYTLDALKTVDGEASNRSYDFEMTYIPEEDGSMPDGILNMSFPMTASSNVNSETGIMGEINFGIVAFAAEGTYSFIVKETIPTGAVTDNVVYDLTEYQIDITVVASTIGNETKYVVSEVQKYKIVDNEGNTLDTPELLTQQDDGLEFTFNNTTDVETVTVTLSKVSTLGNLLSGAKFYVSEMTSATDTTRPSGGYFESVISQNDGSIVISGLEKSTYYMLTEYEAPAGHVLSEGYWVLEIGADGFLLSITAMDGAMDITDNQIVNITEEQAHLEITLTKSNQFADLLEGVEFRVQRVVIEDGVPDVVRNGYDETFTTDENGEIYIEWLEADHIYMITETDGLDSHEEYTGYWLIYVTGDHIHPSIPLNYTIYEYDANHNLVSTVTEDTLMNVRIEFVLPNTGSTGLYLFYALGSILMICSFIYIKKKSLEKRRRRVRNRRNVERADTTHYICRKEG